jgi:hypothetical protein
MGFLICVLIVFEKLLDIHFSRFFAAFQNQHFTPKYFPKMRPAEFESATFGLGNRRSILLSYERNMLFHKSL